MARVYIGTSGYAYDDWHGVVYPRDLPRTRRLEHYLERFPFVELNATYYRPPTEAMIAGITSRILTVRGSDGRLAVKGPGVLTHERPQEERALAEAVGAYAAAVRPACDSAIFAATLLQFPWSFHYTEANRRYLAALLAQLSERLPGQSRVVELRNATWYHERTVEGLRDREAVGVVTDYPALEGLPPRIDLNPFARLWHTGGQRYVGYTRLHGRNEANWWSGTNVTRYDYRYSQSELAELAEQLVERMAGAAAVSTSFVALNNHFRGQAAENASELRALLRSAGLEVP